MLKIEKLDQDKRDKILKLKTEGLSSQAIADNLNADPDLMEEFYDVDIVRYFEKAAGQAMIAIKDNKKLQVELAKKIFGTVDQLNDANEVIWKSLIIYSHI